MNICPGCEAQTDHGLELCSNCADEAVEEAVDSMQDGCAVTGACLELEDGQRIELDREEVLIGRSDPVDQVEPDVDLSCCGNFWFTPSPTATWTRPPIVNTRRGTP